MQGLFHKDDWLKELISEQDLVSWKPEVGECCTAVKGQFKLHLMGTPCNPWNTSATRVFTNDFIHTHAEMYPDVWPVRRMVLKKTKAYIKSLIKSFRLNSRGDALIKAHRLARNRQERKSSVSPSTRFSYLLL